MKNVWKEYKGVKYQSTLEADFAYYLDELLITGKIKAWTGQKTFELIVNEQLICKYKLDFEITNLDNSLTSIDTKGRCEGTEYAYFRIKKKLMKALHGINVIIAKKEKGNWIYLE